MTKVRNSLLCLAMSNFQRAQVQSELREESLSQIPDKFTWNLGESTCSMQRVECGTGRFDKKFVVRIKVHNQEVGSITFFERGDEIIFSGMIIPRHHRGKGLSNFFLSVFESVGSFFKKRADRAHIQGKPLIARALVQNGFVPDVKNPQKNLVYVGQVVGAESQVGLFFENASTKNEFRGTKVCVSQPYTIVEERENIKNAVAVILGVPYKRTLLS